VLNSRRARLILQPRQPGKGIEAEFSVSLHGDAPRGAPSEHPCP
jgi:hypothetical protein